MAPFEWRLLQVASFLITAASLSSVQSLDEAEDCSMMSPSEDRHASALLQVHAQQSISRSEVTLAEIIDLSEGDNEKPAAAWVKSQLAMRTPSSTASTSKEIAEIRLEMARRALMIVGEEDRHSRSLKGDTSPSEATSPSEGKSDTSPSEASESDSGVRSDLPEDVVHNNDTSGSTASLDQAGYEAISQCCCPLEMSVYAERLITHFGFKVCNEGSLQGLVAWYYCKNQSRTFQELADESMNAADGDCAWVGTESSCPVQSKNCPNFPDNSGHRRRTCLARHVEDFSSTTMAPQATNYGIETNTHCGYYQSCGGDKNALYIGDGGNKYTNSTEPAQDCVPVCDGSAECAGFTYIEDRKRCYYRRNVTCGVFQSEMNDCWSKPSA